MKSITPYLMIVLWLIVVESFAEADAWLSIRCLESGGEFRKERPDSFFRGRDLCFRKASK